jgi:taurine dioxygenase
MAMVKLKPLTSVVGAEVEGVDLTEPINEDVAKILRRALLDHLVIFFRDQDITADQQRRAAEVFDPITTIPYVSGKPWPGYSDVFLLEERKGPRGTLSSSDEWHVDNSRLLMPPLGMALHAQTIPEVGGDTCFGSMYAAYDALSPAMQTFLDGLSALHTNRLHQIRSRTNVDFGPTLENIHPVIRVHPETGRRLLYVNVAQTSRIMELGQMESDAILRFLFEHVKEPTFQCRFRWEKHSLAIWDNRAVQHYASADYTGPRKMRRVIIGSEDRPTGPLGTPPGT